MATTSNTSPTAAAPQQQPAPESSQRPWGSFTQYAYNQPVTVKIITVNAGSELSLQRHRHRSELWIALDTTIQVEVDGRAWRPAVHEEVWIPAGSTHRLSAPGDQPGRIMEVAFGHFDEDDIERLSDRYGRA